MQTEGRTQKIAVTGATGRVGSHLVEILEQRGHTVVPIARSKGVDVVTGEVRTPGKVTLPGSSMSVLEALALAGSPTNNASNEVIVIHPPKPGEQSPEPITLNRRDLELGRAGRDITLQDGDIVNVPVAKRFYISGFVKNPGSYVLDTGTTVSQAIVLAGGLAERGTDRRIRIGRAVNGQTVDLPAELGDKVQANDEIKIRARFF